MEHAMRLTCYIRLRAITLINWVVRSTVLTLQRLVPLVCTNLELRTWVPLSFLETVKQKKLELKNVTRQGDGWWQEAAKMLKQTAFRFSKSVRI